MDDAEGAGGVLACNACSVSSLSWIALFDRFNGDLDACVASAKVECTPNVRGSVAATEDIVDGIGDNRDVDTDGDDLDDNFDVAISLSLKVEAWLLEGGLRRLPSLDVFARMAAAAAAAAAATFAVWEVFPDKDVETPFVIVTLEPVGDGIDL